MLREVVVIGESTRQQLRHLEDLGALLESSRVRPATLAEHAAWNAAEAPYLLQRVVGEGSLRMLPKDVPDLDVVDELRASLEGSTGVLLWFDGAAHELVFVEREAFLANPWPFIATQARVCAVGADEQVRLAFDHDLFHGTWFY